MRARGLLLRRTVDDELDEELRYHLEREAERRVAGGMSPGEARLAARRDFGNPTSLAEEARESWRFEWLERLRQDVRFAARSFGRAPGFVATVVLTIGLGLGLLTAAFTIFDTYVLRPNAVREPWALYELWFRDGAGKSRDVAWGEYLAMREGNPAFDDVFAYRWFTARLDGAPLLVQGVSGNFFIGLGVTPALGRVLLPSDASVPGRDPVVVLSHRAWTGRFSSDPSIVGRIVRLNGRAMQVVGVARAGFDGLTGLPPDFWVPVTMSVGLPDEGDPFGPGEPPVLRVIGRLKAGQTEEGGRRAIGSWGAALTRARPEPERVVSARLMSRATPAPLIPQLAAVVIPIGVAFVLVLVIACANVANVMLARGMARQREIGVRLALGAGRGRLLRQLFTESVVLALPAAVVAFAVSRLTIGAATWGVFNSLPTAFVPYVRVLPMSAGYRVFAFLMLAALLAAILFGLAPALQSTRSSVVEATRGDFDSGLRPSRLRNLLVGAQVTVTVLLLICAGVLLRGARRVGAIETGTRVAGLVELRIMESTRASVLAHLRSHPEVVDVARAAQAPIDGGTFPIVSATGGDRARTVATYVNRVTPSFFDVVGLGIRRGRSFAADEARLDAPVAILTEAAVRRVWPRGSGKDGVGATLSLTTGDSTLPRVVQVVGVSGDMVPGAMHLGVDVPIVFLPSSLDDPGVLLARVRGDAVHARVMLEQSLEARIPGAVTEFHTAEEALATMTFPFRYAHGLASALGVVALLLTVTGIYGVVAYLVAQRTRELGIRLALGASRGEVTLLVLRGLLRVALGGIALGTMLSLGVSKLFASQIIAFDTFDLAAYASGIAVAVAACTVAALVPSWRVGEVDPVRALRSE